MKTYNFYGLVDRGKYRNTFHTDLRSPEKLLPLGTNPTFDVPKVQGMCVCVCVCVYAHTHGQPGRHSEPRFTVTLLAAYTYTYIRYV